MKIALCLVMMILAYLAGSNARWACSGKISPYVAWALALVYIIIAYLVGLYAGINEWGL